MHAVTTSSLFILFYSCLSTTTLYVITGSDKNLIIIHAHSSVSYRWWRFPPQPLLTTAQVYLHGCGGAVTCSTPFPDLAAATTWLLLDGNTLAVTMELPPPPPPAVVVDDKTPPTGLGCAGTCTPGRPDEPVEPVFPVFLTGFPTSSTGAGTTPPCSTITSLPSVFTIILYRESKVSAWTKNGMPADTESTAHNKCTILCGGYQTLLGIIPEG